MTTDELLQRGLEEMAYERDLAAQTALAEAAEAKLAGGGLRELLDKRHDEWRDACDERDRALARAEEAAADFELRLSLFQEDVAAALSVAIPDDASDWDAEQEIFDAIIALRTRAEAAEALAKAAADRIMVLEVAFANSHELNESLGNENRALTARVAELEAQLAAQGWRPVTEKPTVTAQYQVVLQSGNRRPTADHRAYYEDTGWVGPGVIFWRPIPPLPPAPVKEPTP